MNLTITNEIIEVTTAIVSFLFYTVGVFSAFNSKESLWKKVLVFFMLIFFLKEILTN